MKQFNSIKQHVTNSLKVYYSYFRDCYNLDEYTTFIAEKVSYKHGPLECELPGFPFIDAMFKDSATMGKIFTCRLLSKMYQSGYDLVVSSQVDVDQSSSSTLFFKKVVIDTRESTKVLCVALGGFLDNKVILLNHTEEVAQVVERAIKINWEQGKEYNCMKKRLKNLLYFA